MIAIHRETLRFFSATVYRRLDPSHQAVPRATVEGE
jgi:hypothetical protein